jgi:small conductance mechanosensitive channel
MENAVHIEKLLDFAFVINQYLVPFGLKVVIAIVLWFIGGFIIKAILRVFNHAMSIRQLDKTLATYAASTVYTALRGVQIMIIMEVCGLKTTSFAALIGAIGVALGVAWSGLLSNFAAGIFLVLLRPFKVGDSITAAGQSGTVTEIGLFVTKIVNDNNILVHIGNNKLFGDNIINFSSNPTRRADLRFQIAHGTDVEVVMQTLLTTIQAIPDVLTDPAPSVSVVELNASGILFAVRFYAPTASFGTCSNAANKALAQLYVNGPWSAPATYQVSVLTNEQKSA